MDKLYDRYEFDFDYSYHIDRIIKEYKIWEHHVVAYIANVVKEGCVTVDVGANAGYHTLLMADLGGKTGSVHAFEPNPRTCARLKKISNLTRCCPDA